jgi:hypothetical protein
MRELISGSYKGELQIANSGDGTITCSAVDVPALISVTW